MNAPANYTGPTAITTGRLIFGGNAAHSVGPITGSGSLVIAPATLLVSQSVQLTGAWVINGTHTLAPASNISSTRSLTLAGTTNNWTAKLDLTDNPLLLAATSSNKATTASTLVNQLTSAKNTGTNGPWTGNGITSSTIAANPSQLTIGLFDNADLNLPSYAGQPLDANSLLLVPTQIGDANLDHNVDLADYDAWYQHVGASFPLSSYGMPNSPIPIPEPATGAWPLAILLLYRTRRRTRT